MESRTGPRGHILVVDDEPDVCESLAETLRASGLAAEGATSLAEALDSARKCPPDLVIADLKLGDASGVEVVDHLRKNLGDLPAIFMTGYGDPEDLFEASRRRPVEMIHKPVDLDRLRRTVERELSGRGDDRHQRAYSMLCQTCADLTGTCRGLQGQIDRQDLLIAYQNDLIGASGPDDVFRRLFCLFLERSGGVFGVAMLCDENAELQLTGRFGVPVPDQAHFCQSLAMATLAPTLKRPEVTVIDAMDNVEMFPEAVRPRLVGLTLLVIPLMVREGEMIGLVVLYRKGEQPFTDDDVALAQMLARSTAAAAQRPAPPKTDFAV